MSIWFNANYFRCAQSVAVDQSLKEERKKGSETESGRVPNIRLAVVSPENISEGMWNNQESRHETHH